MNSQEFVAALRIVACDKASSGVLTTIQHPPGRSPDPALLDLSKWYNDLEVYDKAMVVSLTNLATRQAVYNVLLVLDGLLAVSPQGHNVEFELFAKECGGAELLNSTNTQPLSHWFKKK
jgi:hypothetical protein